MADNLARALRLMLVTDDAAVGGRDLVLLAQEAVAGGATSVQLRLKRATARELAEAGRALLAALDVPLIVNDRLDVAIAIGAAGVHLGPDDVPPAAARRLAPPGFVIGASVGTPAEVPLGAAADYWGVGPFRATGTKRDAGAALGTEGLRALVDVAAGRPCIAIGGIRPEEVPHALAGGAVGVAVVSGILATVDPRAASARFRAALDATVPTDD